MPGTARGKERERKSGKMQQSQQAYSENQMQTESMLSLATHVAIPSP